MLLTPHHSGSRPFVSWTPPDHDSIKVNVDGSYSPSSSGIGGVFRDHRASLLHFSKQVEAISAIHTEVLAIREGILIAAACRWYNLAHFQFESDSCNAVSWIRDPSSTPWRFQNLVCEAVLRFSRHINWFMSHIRRTGNEATYVLASVGASDSSFIKFA